MFEPLHIDSLDAHVCAAAADPRAPLVPGLLTALDRVDIDGLDASAAVDAAVGFDHLINHGHALRLQAVSTTVLRYQRFEKVDPERSAAAELGPLLGLSTRSANAEITYAWELTGRLRRTWQRMHDGVVSYGKARLLVDETLDLTTEQAQAVEDLVIDEAGTRTFSQHAAAVRRAVVRVDPSAPERRRRNLDRTVQLVRRYSSDGLADLVVTMPAAQVDAAYTAADAWARARKAGGDERSLEVLRAEAVVRWASSYLIHGDSATCDTVCDPAGASPAAPPDRTQTEEPVSDTLADHADGDDADGDVADADADHADADDTDGDVADADAQARDTAADDALPGEAPADDTDVPAGRAPARHGRKLGIGIVWGLQALVGVDDLPGELVDSGEMIGAADLRELVAGGIRLRRMLIDPSSGHLVDLTPGWWSLPPTAGRSTPSSPHHGQPYWLGVVVDTETWTAYRDGTLTGPLADAIASAPAAVRDLLAASRSDASLDVRPGADTPSVQLAEFVALRDRHPTNPTAAPTAAGAGDVDHIVARAAGGPTIARNLHSPSRRWHVLRTLGGWRVRRDPSGAVVWTSPQGRSYRIDPYDYRQGP